MDVNALLRYTVERGASDLHLKVGNVPFVRIDGAAAAGRVRRADVDRHGDGRRRR